MFSLLISCIIAYYILACNIQARCLYMAGTFLHPLRKDVTNTVLAAEWYCISNLFSHWLRPCSNIERNWPWLQFYTNPREQGSCDQHGAHLGPVGPRWAPCWPHELCYQGVCDKCKCYSTCTWLTFGSRTDAQIFHLSSDMIIRDLLQPALLTLLLLCQPPCLVVYSSNRFCLLA